MREAGAQVSRLMYPIAGMHLPIYVGSLATYIQALPIGNDAKQFSDVAAKGLMELCPHPRFPVRMRMILSPQDADERGTIYKVLLAD
jgi:hypothetical protein